jgi:hypothetical protein
VCGANKEKAVRSNPESLRHRQGLPGFQAATSRVTTQEFNAECVRKLQAAKFADRVAIIGSGPSLPFVAGVKKITAAMKDACGVEPLPGEMSWDFFERAFRKNADGYYGVIEQHFEAEVPNWEARAYRHLGHIPFRSYVTFNYDPQLPSIFRERHPNDYQGLFSVYPSANGDDGTVAQASDLGGHKQRLVAAHGYADPQNGQWARQVILKTSDYDLHYTSPVTRRFLLNWWKNLLATWPCVIIGASMKEPGIYNVVKALERDANPLLKKQDHIHLLDVSFEENPAEYPVGGVTLGAFRQIPYHPEDSKFTGLLRVLAPFSGIPFGTPSPGVIEVRPIAVGDSYDFK